MTRLSALLLSVLIAAAPLGAANAQDRGARGDRDRGNQDMQREPRRISEAEAQGIAQSRARGARFVGSLGMRGNSYVFRFERDGQIIDISVDSRG